MPKTIYYPCEVLIDQGRYIDEDPVGHACSNYATYEWNDVAVCTSCKMLLETEPERIALPVFQYSLEERQADWKKWVKDMIRVETERQEDV